MTALSLAVLFAALVLLRLNGTFLEPRFYTDLLQREEVYSFVMTDALASALDEAREVEVVGFDGNPLVVSGMTTQQLASAVNRALPPERLEEIVAPAILQVGEYSTAERDAVAVIVPFGDVALTIVEEVETLLAESGAYAQLIELEVRPRMRKALLEAMADDPDLADWTPYLFDTNEAAADSVMRFVAKVATPEWMRAQVESALDEVTPYMLREADGFEVRLRPTDEQVEAIAAETKAILREGGIYDLIFEREIEPRLRDAVDEALAADSGVSRWTAVLFGASGQTADRLTRAARRVMPPEWIRAQVESALDEAAPYLAGRSDRFEVKLRLSEKQVEAAVAEVKAILREGDAYDLVYTDVVEPAVRDILGGSVALPYGVEVTEDEIIAALRQAAPTEWVQGQAEALIADAALYLAGRSDGFSTTVSLERNKQRAEQALAVLVNSKLAEAVSGLPACRDRAESAAAEASLEDGVPDCVPPGISASVLVKQAGPVLATAITALALAPVPNSVSFTHSDLRLGVMRSGGQDTLDFLDDARRLLGKGWPYDSAALREDLADNAGTLDELRALLSDGYTYTHQDLRDDLSAGAVETLDAVRTLLADSSLYTHEYDPELGAGDSALDAIRGRVATIRQYGWIAYAAMPILLVVIGLLGGRTWRSKAAWSTSALLVVSSASLILSWPIYDLFIDTALDGMAPQFGTGGSFQSTSLLVTGKTLAVARSAMDEFVGGVRLSSFILMSLASAALLGALLERLYLSRKDY